MDFLKSDDVIQDSQTIRCGNPVEWQDLFIRNMPATVDAACKAAAMGTSLGMKYCGNPTLFPCTTASSEGIPVDALSSCIPQTLICDRTEHCLNGLDENPFICNGYRRLPKTTADSLPTTKSDSGYLEGVFQRYGPVGPPIASATIASTALAATTPFVEQTVNCRKGAFQCFSGGYCISAFKVCDGTADCPDGADEEVTRCSNATDKAAVGLASPSSVSFLYLTNTTAKMEEKIIAVTPLFVDVERHTNTTNVPSAFFPTYKISIDNGLNNDQGFSEKGHAFQSVLPTDFATHPTITFPKVFGMEHVNSLQESGPMTRTDYAVTEQMLPTGVDPVVPESVIGSSKQHPESNIVVHRC